MSAAYVTVDVWVRINLIVMTLPIPAKTGQIVKKHRHPESAVNPFSAHAKQE